MTRGHPPMPPPGPPGPVAAGDLARLGAVWAGSTEAVGELLGSVERRLAVARALSLGLALTVGISFMLVPLAGLDIAGFVGLVAAAMWLLLAVRGAKVGQMARQAAGRLSLGRTDDAERLARDAARRFTLLRPGTLGALQVLAGVFQQTGRHEAAAQVAAFLLGRREKVMAGGLGPADPREMRLLLAESLLAAGQVEVARHATFPLYGDQLDLPLALRLLLVQTRIEAALGQWQATGERIGAKLDMAELMPPDASLEMHRLLLESSERTGQQEWAEFLSRRVAILEGKGESTEPAEDKVSTKATEAGSQELGDGGQVQ